MLQGSGCPITLYEKKAQPRRWPPPSQFDRQPEERTERSAHEAVTFTVTPGDAPEAQVRRHIEVATEEKVGDAPVEKESGDGRFVFDTRRGLVESMELKRTGGR